MKINNKLILGTLLFSFFACSKKKDKNNDTTFKVEEENIVAITPGNDTVFFGGSIWFNDSIDMKLASGYFKMEEKSMNKGEASSSNAFYSITGLISPQNTAALSNFYAVLNSNGNASRDNSNVGDTILSLNPFEILKLNGTVTDTIRSAFQMSATSYRTGRYSYVNNGLNARLEYTNGQNTEAAVGANTRKTVDSFSIQTNQNSIQFYRENSAQVDSADIVLNLNRSTMLMIMTYEKLSDKEIKVTKVSIRKTVEQKNKDQETETNIKSDAVLRDLNIVFTKKR